MNQFVLATGVKKHSCGIDGKSSYLSWLMCILWSYIQL